MEHHASPLFTARPVPDSRSFRCYARARTIHTLVHKVHASSLATDGGLRVSHKSLADFFGFGIFGPFHVILMLTYAAIISVVVRWVVKIGFAKQER